MSKLDASANVDDAENNSMTEYGSFHLLWLRTHSLLEMIITIGCILSGVKFYRKRKRWRKFTRSCSSNTALFKPTLMMPFQRKMTFRLGSRHPTKKRIIGGTRKRTYNFEGSMTE